MSKRMKSLIALVLTVCLLLSAMPTYGAAEAIEEDGSVTTSVTENELTDGSSTDVMEIESEETPYIVREDPSLRGAYEKHYLMSDGSYQAAVYNEPVHRLEDGAWVEIDEYQRGHASGHYDDIGVLVLGDFESRPANMFSPNTLNDAQKDAMIEIGKWLCFAYDIPVDISNGPITTHRQVNPGDTVCPGENMAPWVESTLLNTILNWRK